MMLLDIVLLFMLFMLLLAELVTRVRFVLSATAFFVVFAGVMLLGGWIIEEEEYRLLF